MFPDVVHGAYVHRLPSVPLAGYANVRVAMGGVYRVKRILADYAPDVVHLASPFVLGWRAAQAAHQLGIPTVAIYQTEVPSYAARYGVPFLENWAWNRVENIHLLATRTLAPSTFALNQLRGRGIPRVDMWRRGVDTARFSPEKRDAGWRASVAPGGERIIGYVGRLAVEKQVEDLAVLADVPGTRLVIVGDGPQRAALEEALPGAVFTGFLGGEELARAVASFDLFVHPGRVRDLLPDHPGGHGVRGAGGGHGPRRPAGPGGELPDRLAVPARRPGRRCGRRVMDLMGDDAKRRAFAAAAHASVQGRTWPALSAELVRVPLVIAGDRCIADRSGQLACRDARTIEGAGPVKISVIGCGYLGAVHAATLASMGHTVVGIDVDPGQGGPPGRAASPPSSNRAWTNCCATAGPPAGSRFSTDFADAAGAQVHFLCVGTPQSKTSDGADLSYLVVRHRKSPSAPGPGCRRRRQVNGARGHRRHARRHPGRARRTCCCGWNPEFLRQGTAVKDTLVPDRLVFGVPGGDAALSRSGRRAA